MREPFKLPWMLPGIYLPGFVVCILLLVSFTGSAQSADRSPVDAIDHLLARKSFFEARELYERHASEMETVDRLKLGAIIDNAFNRLESSSNKINELQQRFSNTVDDSTHLYLLELQQSNYARLYRYREAAACIGLILKRYSAALTESERSDFLNTLNIWSALADAPPQEVIVRERTVLHMQRDKAELFNLEVSRDSVHIGFIFDTGANISTVTQTTAQRLGMRMTNAAIEVNSITGIKIQSGLAVCPELRIGSIIVKNAVFLVFPDSALAIPQIDFQINGIIGFPVIEAMKEVQISRDGDFIVPVVRETTKDPNLALDYLTPIIRLGDEHYTFDSGASSTMLYKSYFDKHRPAIEKRGKKKKSDYGGAGGNISRDGYQITWKPIVNGKKTPIEKVMVFNDTLRENEALFYGNVGQDLIGSFEKMTLNFEAMFIRFE